MLYLKYISTIHSNINRKISKGFNMYCRQADLIAIRNQRKRILGLDIGDSRIGVSIWRKASFPKFKVNKILKTL